MKLKKSLSLIVIMMLMMSILAACNNDIANVSSENLDGSGGTLRIGMTAANIPVPDSRPTEGYEGMRFVGYQLYDGLVNWDLTASDKTPEIIPGLAESWEHSEENPLAWTFKLRQDATFHDGTAFNADSVIFAFERLMNPEFEFYNPTVAGSSTSELKFIEGYKKLDDFTVEFTTSEPYANLLYDLVMLLIPSPEAVKQLGDGFSNAPVGTGPFKFESMKQGQEIVLVKNENYWGDVAKLDKLVLRPISDPAARLAALQSGEIDWAEVPPTDAIAQLEGQNYQMFTNEYPHNWIYILNMQEGPWKDQKVRQAANYAIDRVGLSEILIGGAGSPASQVMYKGNTWYSEDAEPYTYDPEKAKQLLADAGYPEGFKTKFLVPTSGSGNMWPIPMNEYVQKNLKEVGIEVEIETMEWNSLITQFLQGFPSGSDFSAINFSLSPISPNMFTKYFSTTTIAPNGANSGAYSNPKVDALLTEINQTFDKAKQDQLLQQVSKIIADDAPWIFVTHDLNLRALSPNIHGFTQPQSWFVDLKSVYKQ